MDNTVLFFAIGGLIGIVLFFAFERMGLLSKWSGLGDVKLKSNDKTRDIK